MEKSQLLLSANVEVEMGIWLSATFEIPITYNLGMYLGLPLLYRRVGKDTYHYHVDKVRWKLSAWNG